MPRKREATLREDLRVAWFGEEDIVVEGIPKVNRVSASVTAEQKEGEEELTHPRKRSVDACATATARTPVNEKEP